MHDIQLDTISDVAKKFPDRKRADGHYYALDFTLAEIKQLQAHERINPKTGKAAFPGRFPPGQSSFQIPSLEEELQLIQGLNKIHRTHRGHLPRNQAAGLASQAGTRHQPHRAADSAQIWLRDKARRVLAAVLRVRRSEAHPHRTRLAGQARVCLAAETSTARVSRRSRKLPTASAPRWARSSPENQSPIARSPIS